MTPQSTNRNLQSSHALNINDLEALFTDYTPRSSSQTQNTCINPYKVHFNSKMFIESHSRRRGIQHDKTHSISIRNKDSAGNHQWRGREEANGAKDGDEYEGITKSK